MHGRATDCLRYRSGLVLNENCFEPLEFVNPAREARYARAHAVESFARLGVRRGISILGRARSLNLALNECTYIDIDVARAISRLANGTMVSIDGHGTRSDQAGITTIRLYDHSKDAYWLRFSESEMRNTPGVCPDAIPQIEIAQVRVIAHKTRSRSRRPDQDA